MIAEVEIGFKQTCKLLLGAELSSTDDYAKWLGKRVPLPYLTKSALSEKEVWLPPSYNYLKKYFNKSRSISMDELEKIIYSNFKADDLKNASLDDIRKKFLVPFAFCIGNIRYWEHANIEKCSGVGGGMNIYYCEDVYHGVKNIAYSNYIHYSENLFGCHGLTYSKFCIHAYNSTKLTRCFEADGCSNSSDLIFCHDCEGMSNAMFCFNAKNLRYAVGNVEVGRDNFVKIKKMLLDYVVNELKTKKMLELDIYNLGCWKA